MSQVPAPVPTAEHDPFAWLEEVDGERAMAWVREQNARTVAGLAASELAVPSLFPWYFGASVHDLPLLLQPAPI